MFRLYHNMFIRFDIGNHFCEFAGFDYSKFQSCYPNKAAQYSFFEAYLQASREGQTRIENYELDAMYIEANRYAMAGKYMRMYADV